MAFVSFAYSVFYLLWRYFALLVVCWSGGALTRWSGPYLSLGSGKLLALLRTMRHRLHSN